jgi:2-polyprenyl-3-methyl-5-hydroxy-6-metoxy-1,4-benzoquinol methylase
VSHDVRPCLSVVMPCYNEASTVTKVADRVLASPYTAELIIVDDGSTDGTLDLARTIGDRRVRVVSQGRNQGKGAALRRGFSLAAAPFVIVQDADLEYDPADFEQVLGPLLEGQADVVYGSRFHSNRPHRVLYYWHSLGNHLLTTASNMATDLNLTDMETCYKAFRREVIQSFVIEEDRFGFEPEITAKVAGGGWRVYEVGISYAGRTYAEGKKIGWKDGMRAMYCIVRYSPLRERTHERLVGRARRPAVPASFAEADAELVATLDSLDGAQRYAEWIFSLIEPHLGERILEVGAGLGTFTQLLARRGRVVATDMSARCVEALRDRYREWPAVQVDHMDLSASVAGRTFDSIVLVNVLEHIDDDATALKELHDGLEPGGRLILWVPAFMRLYSDFDRRIGHYRRYDMAGLTRLVGEAGFEVVDARYVNSVGALAWWLLARKLGRTPTAEGGVRLFDRAFVPVVRGIEEHWRPPFGQSIFCVAQVPGGA